MSDEAKARPDQFEMRRKRLQFRAWHRGMREVDLLLGRFADAMLKMGAEFDKEAVMTELSAFYSA